MLRFGLVRFGRAVLTLWFVMTFTFVVMRLTGDPARAFLPDTATDEVVALFRARWGLDQPIWAQYLTYLGGLAGGDFGQSLSNGRDALDMVAERLPQTLKLTGTALVIILSMGILAGVVAALNRGKPLDRALMAVCALGYSLPNFVLGIGLIFWFAVHLRLLPSSGSATTAHMVLPVVTLGVSGATVIARFTRSAMLEVLAEPYFTAALAAGETRRGAILRHVLPNAAIPVVTIIGFMIGGLVGGSIIVEQVFARPGIGRLLVESVGLRDLAVVQALVMLFAGAMVTANFAVDMLYGLLNPRIRRRAA